MKSILPLLTLAAAFVVSGPVAGAPAAGPAEPVRRAKPAVPGTAWSVQVGDVPLVFTRAVTAGRGSPSGADEGTRALEALGAVLAASGSGLADVVRLTAYASSDAADAAASAAVARGFADRPVALTRLRTPLAAAGATLAFEAVAVGRRPAAGVTVSDAGAAVLPAGGKIFISGQAERGPDLAAAVRLTMAGLWRTLDHLGLRRTDVVQVKAFITPFAGHAAATREIAASFGGASVPPVVLLAWESTLFAEIELVVSASRLAPPEKDRIAYAPLPWLTPSPRYSKVVHVAAGTPLIFIGELDGGGAAGARNQMKAIFERLGSVLFDAGSSYRHLAKATYYLGPPETRTLLGDIRGVYFDPTRAPAASALTMASLGDPGRTALLDMIAIPAK